jgi:hypothetical protein
MRVTGNAWRTARPGCTHRYDEADYRVRLRSHLSREGGGIGVAVVRDPSPPRMS